MNHFRGAANLPAKPPSYRQRARAERLREVQQVREALRSMLKLDHGARVLVLAK
jgi:hypothetical protein